ncbi:hypothetical protein HZA97_00845 [Candidatus Woesearchaeota archaeon]|nr:hypothetical protein [Candidatus Woesearchaeota archaeon]
MPTKTELRTEAKDIALISILCLGITAIPAASIYWSVNEASKEKTRKEHLVVPLEQLQDTYQKSLEEYGKTGSKELLEKTENKIEDTKIQLNGLEQELKKYQVNTPEVVDKIGTTQTKLQEILSQHSIFGASYKEYKALEENQKIIQEQNRELKNKIDYDDNFGPLGILLILPITFTVFGGFVVIALALDALTNYTKSFFASD